MKTLSNFLICSLSVLSGKLNAQDLNRKNIVHQLKADKESLFVINGAAFTYSDSLKLDAELNNINANSTYKLTVLKNEGKIPHQKNDIIIILYPTKGKK